MPDDEPEMGQGSYWGRALKKKRLGNPQEADPETRQRGSYSGGSFGTQELEVATLCGVE